MPETIPMLRIEGRSYKVGIVSILLMVFIFGTILLMIVSPEIDPRFFFILSTIMCMGFVMGVLAGLPRLSIVPDMNAVLIGLTGYVALAVGTFILGLDLSILNTSTLTLLYAPLAEEIAFRFGLHRFLARFMKDYMALVIQAVIFGIYHWMVYPGYTELAWYPILAGLIFGILNTMTRNLDAPLIAHFLNNLTVAIMQWW